MQILLNGELHEIEAGLSLAGLLERFGLTQRRVAIEVNGEIVPRSLHAGHVLREGDRIEVVHALGGG
ncbi:MAG: sulfur carrier protein ThiS [Silanimonas sp.]|nr:MAG: sulfur carrier protein ThiS [Silanimonas sp.]